MKNTTYKGHTVSVEATGRNFGYISAVYRDGQKVWVLDTPRGTAKSAKDAAEAYIDSLRYTIRKPGYSKWATVETYPEAVRERANANRVCQPGHIIVTETP